MRGSEMRDSEAEQDNAAERERRKVYKEREIALLHSASLSLSLNKEPRSQ
jgi:hypothetical protein